MVSVTLHCCFVYRKKLGKVGPKTQDRDTYVLQRNLPNTACLQHSLRHPCYCQMPRCSDRPSVPIHWFFFFFFVPRSCTNLIPSPAHQALWRNFSYCGTTLSHPLWRFCSCCDSMLSSAIGYHDWSKRSFLADASFGKYFSCRAAWPAVGQHGHWQFESRPAPQDPVHILTIYGQFKPKLPGSQRCLLLPWTPATYF